MLEACTFMKSDVDVITTYKARYDEALQLAKRLGDGLEKQDSYRNGYPKVKVT